jgi:hypothetical protein
MDEVMVGLARFELATNGLGNRCSIHLSYSPSSTDYTIFAAMRLSTGLLPFNIKFAIIPCGSKFSSRNSR